MLCRPDKASATSAGSSGTCITNQTCPIFGHIGSKQPGLYALLPCSISRKQVLQEGHHLGGTCSLHVRWALKEQTAEGCQPPASPAAECKSFFEGEREQYVPTFTTPSKLYKQIICIHRERLKERVRGGVRERETEKQLISQYFRTLFISKNGSKHACHIPDLKGNIFKVSSLSVILAVQVFVG